MHSQHDASRGHRLIAGNQFCIYLIADHVERMKRRACHLSYQQLERAFRSFEIVPTVFQVLDAVQQFAPAVRLNALSIRAASACIDVAAAR